MSLIAAIIASALASAGVGLAGALINKKATENTNAANLQLEKDKMAFNAQQAEINRNWEENMSNTAYQRQFADMEAAGLNPYLVSQSNGAVVPSGSIASASSGGRQETPRLDLDGVAGAISSMGNLLVMKAFMDGKISAANDANAIRHEYNEAYGRANAGRATKDLSIASANKAKADYFRSGGKRVVEEPEWLKKYKKHFEEGVRDL